MMKKVFYCLIIVPFFLASAYGQTTSWIRINQLGYPPEAMKVAVWCSKEDIKIDTFKLMDAMTSKCVFTGKAGNPFGSYGPFSQTFRLNFTAFQKPGEYYLAAGSARSPQFKINADVYQGAADFCLRYLRQQRSGFNPFLNDSCHTHDGYSLYGGMAGIKDSTFFDVTGGWHDASDYLQYSATSANATYHLLAAYRDFSQVFSDTHLANGLPGENKIPDILDEARWGTEWLLKMHPSENVMFNQLADDRDHQGMRIPKEDSFYGRGFERPVYFIDGEPQQRGQFLNDTKGTSSTAAKFSSVFSLGSLIFSKEKTFRDTLTARALSALHFSRRKYGVTQTASVRSPYIYAEENWVDDMELAFAAMHNVVLPKKEKEETARYNFLDSAISYASREPVTPWLGADTASHYQWYPFINLGHYELAKLLNGRQRDSVVAFYKKGIELVEAKARHNAFYRGVPFIWCSNNLTVSFAIQCFWYYQLTGDDRFEELAQANIDWLFGANPWGTSMVYGLPSLGDTPTDPHSAFTHLKDYPIDGGLVDGPVYGNIYKNLIGITLYKPDEYADFQSDLVVYHDDYGDYSTNEPTMDGTASLLYLLAAKEASAGIAKPDTSSHFPEGIHSRNGQWKDGDAGQIQIDHGAIVRGDKRKKRIAIIFSGDEFAEGGKDILNALTKEKAAASFFFTGNFYRNPSFKKLIKAIKKRGDYLGPHSDKHLLYCDWKNRDSLLVTRQAFSRDLENNYDAMESFGIMKKEGLYFLPPFEWYNDSVATWTSELGLQLINYTAGTVSHADYTMEKDKNFRSSQEIMQSIQRYASKDSDGLNGFILLMHVGAGPERKDKFYKHLPALIDWFRSEGYEVVTLRKLLSP